MKQLSLVLNAVLIVAVGILYYLHFSDKKEPVKKVKPAASASSGSATPDTKAGLAYVELDSLMEKITYVKNKRKELEAEEQSIATEWDNGLRGLEMKKNNFLKKGASITQEEAEKFQGELYQDQQQLEVRKQNRAQKLNEKHYTFMDDLQKKLKDFLAKYNDEKNYRYRFSTGNGLEYMLYKDSTMNITQDVIDGMNEIMSEKTK